VTERLAARVATGRRAVVATRVFAARIAGVSVPTGLTEGHIALGTHVHETAVVARTRPTRAESHIAARPAQRSFAVLAVRGVLAVEARPPPAHLTTPHIVQAVVASLRSVERTRNAAPWTTARDHLLVGAGTPAHLADEPATRTEVVSDVAVAANVQPAACGTVWAVVVTNVRDARASGTVP
jgi:hypothetical protein